MSDNCAPLISICFVCLGNICRSPTAAGVMLELLESEGLARRVAVESAGMLDHHAGELPDRRARAAARARGISLSSRARQFKAEDFARFDYVLAMDAKNLEALARLAPDAQAREKVCLFRCFDPKAAPGAEVPDPYFGGAQGFEQVLDLCEAAARGLLEHLRSQHGF